MLDIKYLCIHTLMSARQVCFPSIILNDSRSKYRQQKLHYKFPSKHHSNHMPYPKSSPTPLLLQPQNPTAITRAEALDRVLDDLELALRRGVFIEPFIFSSLLETCCNLRSLEQGLRVRRLIPASLFRRSAALCYKLIRLYASCGHVEEAHQLFDQMPQRHKRNAFAWNCLISGYTEVGQYEDALALYNQMEEEGLEPDEYTFPRVLKACAGIGLVQVGQAVHRHVVRSGFANDVYVLNALVDMYSKCGDIQKARKIFDMIPQRDPISWNSMIIGYLRHELFLEAIDIFRYMIDAEIKPDSVTISAMVSRFTSCLNNPIFGFQLHGWAIRQGLEWDLSVANSLILMYSECGRLDTAQLIFELMPKKDLISWNAIIAAHRRDHQVFKLFRKMEDSGLLPDQVTFVSLLSACANLGLVENGQNLFTLMKKKYRIEPTMEHYGCMVNLLGRSRLVDEAYRLILSMPFEGGPTIWGALLYACLLNGNVEIGEIAADRLFELEPDNEHNFELLMKIYSTVKRLDDVEKVRKLMMERGLNSDFVLASSLTQVNKDYK